jgi:putative DNA methylase
MTTTPRKKLIEVALPLEEINKASAREKSIRHGHPSTLHLWWARRPLAACRAVIFAQLVDDPSAWPDRFPSPEAQAEERKRLHNLIARMVPWEASNNEAILSEARFEIARSVAWGRGEEPPTMPAEVLAYLQNHAPPVYDPFCGGGSIPLEAQRLGLRAYGSDLNPVAVLISKALVEIPPKFADQKPINPETRAKKDLIGRQWKGAQGLAEDVRHYGAWMRAEAEKRIGKLYPKVKLADGTHATVIAWLWTRTVRSPDPAAKEVHVPLASTFLLSTREGKKAWIEPIVDHATASYRFEVRTGRLSAEEEAQRKNGTKAARGANFICLITGSPIAGDWIKAEGKAGRMGARLMAIVAEGVGGRTYLSPTDEHERVAESAEYGDVSGIDQPMPKNPRWFSPPDYGFPNYKDIFTSRQLAALTTFSDLVSEVRAKVLSDAHSAGLSDDGLPLHAGGNGATAFADAVATYLAFALSKIANIGSSIASWMSDRGAFRETFARQAIPMTWDYAEANTFADAGGSVRTAIEKIAMAIEHAPPAGMGKVGLIDAPANNYPIRPVAISTDPPYYDNIGYADLSDFFYVWLRRSLGDRENTEAVWPELFRRLLVPKAEELIATPFRFADASPPLWAREVPSLSENWPDLSQRDRAEAFFMHGMGKALKAMHDASDADTPLAIYYAFKQSEAAQDGVTSAGWSSFLQAAVNAGLAIDGTWPVRTEGPGRIVGIGTNALASSIVLVCRKRDPTATGIERDEFKRALRRELPDALAKIRAAGVGPVDMAQAAIGPGMGVFTRHSAVLEASGEAMKVKDALKLINEVRDEIDDEGDYDLETRFAVEWFAEAQWEAKESGRAILLANAKNLAESQLERAGIIDAHAGKTRLRRRDEIGSAYNPADDTTPTVWEHAQALAYVLETGGQDAAASLFARLNNTEAVRALAYRLYGLCERKGWSAEALVWNRLAEEWRRIEDLAASAPPPVATREGDLFGGAT